MGGHVIKCGLAGILLDLMGRGWVTGFVMNGAASIHDFEIAIAGQTSEDVEAVLPDGRFGAAEETGREMNLAIADGDRDELGMGEALGRRLKTLAKPDLARFSVLYGAYQALVPVTVHVAIGTDTPHTHPAANAAAIGSATHRDFRLLCSLVRGLNDGGVYLNVGSAVVLPEVFLKAVSVVRNLQHPLTEFTTVNFDFLQHYRPKMNVSSGRMYAAAAGTAYAHHRPSRTHDPAAGGGAGRKRCMTRPFCGGSYEDPRFGISVAGRRGAAVPGDFVRPDAAFPVSQRRRANGGVSERVLRAVAGRTLFSDRDAAAAAVLEFARLDVSLSAVAWAAGDRGSDFGDLSLAALARTAARAAESR